MYFLFTSFDKVWSMDIGVTLDAEFQLTVYHLPATKMWWNLMSEQFGSNQCFCMWPLLSPWQYEPPHDKTNKMTECPVKTQISLGIRPVWSDSSLSTWRKLESLATQWVHSDDSDQTGQMPKLIWVFAGCTDHFVGFVMRQLIYWGTYNNQRIITVTTSSYRHSHFGNVLPNTPLRQGYNNSSRKPYKDIIQVLFI